MGVRGMKSVMTFMTLGWAVLKLAVPTALVVTLGVMPAAMSQTVAISAGTSGIELSGTSGGSRTDGSCAGNIAPTANHTIEVRQDMNLRFTLKADGGRPALLIRSASGQEFCVPANSDSGGKVVIPGRWAQGRYDIFVGDRANGHHAYTLSVSGN